MSAFSSQVFAVSCSSTAGNSLVQIKARRATNAAGGEV